MTVAVMPFLFGFVRETDQVGALQPESKLRNCHKCCVPEQVIIFMQQRRIRSLGQQIIRCSRIPATNCAPSSIPYSEQISKHRGENGQGCVPLRRSIHLSPFGTQSEAKLSSLAITWLRLFLRAGLFTTLTFRML